MAEETVNGNIVVNLDTTPAVQAAEQADKKIKQAMTGVEKSVTSAEQAVQELGVAAAKMADKVEAAGKKVEASQKRTAGALTEAAKKNRQLAVIQAESGQKQRTIRIAETERGIRERGTIGARSDAALKLESEKRQTEGFRQEQRRRTLILQSELDQRNSILRRTTRQQVEIQKTGASELNAALKRTIGLPSSVRPQVQLALGGPTAQRRRSSMVGFGMTPTEAVIAQLSERFSPEEAAFLAGAGQKPLSFGRAPTSQELRRSQLLQAMQNAPSGVLASQVWQQQMNASLFRSNVAGNAALARYNRQAYPNLYQPQVAAGGAGGGFFGAGGLGRRLLGGGGGGALGGFASGLLGGLGVGIGGYAASRAMGAVVESTQTAVAYERQRVAAEQLAGGQAKLNDLIEAYSKASGGAIDKVTTLGNVTRLLATGYAESVPEVERFIKATRGASIALGRPQDYIVQETQLAISNTSVKRLDQIGLGVVEVQERIKALRKENREWTREQAFQEAVLTLMEEKYGKLTSTMEGQKTGLEKLTAAWNDFILALGQNSQGPINRASQALADLLNHIIDVNNEIEKTRNSGKNPAEAQGLNWFDQGVANLFSLSPASPSNPEFGPNGAMTRGWNDQRWTRELNQRQSWNNFANLFGMTPALTPPAPQFGPRMAPPPVSYPVAPTTPPLGRFEEDQAAAIRNAYQALQDMERDYQKQRLNASTQYEQQRSDIIRNYGKQLAREEEDFQRSRARSLRDYERSILDVMRDAQERDRELQEDLDDRIAEMREDNGKRVEDIEEKYRKDRERAEKEHRDRLLTAAGQLDAIAVLEERKRWKRENQEREEGHKDALEEQRENLEEQIEDARKAHQERLEDARKADERRLEDMRVNRERQLADEDEDRAVRKARAAQDHQDQLDELARQHALTMQRLEDEAEEQRQLLEDALAKDLEAVGVYIEGYQEKMEERDKKIEKWFDEILKRLEKVIEKERKLTERETNPNYVGGGMTPFASGGPVKRTGPALLHSGEYVLSKDMLAAGWSPVMNSASYNSRNITFGAGAIQVQTTPGAEYMVATMVEERLIELLGAV